MGDTARVLDVDLLGTQHLLDAFEPLVVPGSSAVCFSSSSAYIIAPFVNADLEALLADRRAPDFIERAVEVVGGDSGFAYRSRRSG